MLTTPAIPAWIREIEHPQYRNIFSLRLGNQNLWGMETLLGDWSGRHLPVAKDFYSASYMEEAIAQGDPAPYRHNPSAPSNRNLLKTLKHFGVAFGAGQEDRCDFLYIWACFLLRNDGMKRGPLPDANQLLRLSSPVVEFTMNKMSNLTKIVLMGREARESAYIGGVNDLVSSRGLRMVEVSHPSFGMSYAQRFAQWERVFSAA